MGVGTAIGIFSDINSDKFSHKEKAEAIYIVVFKNKVKEVKKEAMADVIRWLWSRCFRVRENTESTSNTI